METIEACVVGLGLQLTLCLGNSSRSHSCVLQYLFVAILFDSDIRHSEDSQVNSSFQHLVNNTPLTQI